MVKLNLIELNKVRLNTVFLNGVSEDNIRRRGAGGAVTPSAPAGYEEFFASDGLFRAADGAFYVKR